MSRGDQSTTAKHRSSVSILDASLKKIARCGQRRAGYGPSRGHGSCRMPQHLKQACWYGCSPGGLPVSIGEVPSWEGNPWAVFSEEGAVGGVRPPGGALPGEVPRVVAGFDTAVESALEAICAEVTTLCSAPGKCCTLKPLARTLHELSI